MLALAFTLVACQSQSGTVAAPPQQDQKGMEKFATDKDFHKAHTLRQPDKVQLKGKEIEFAVSEGKAKAYWVAPVEGHKQAVLMIHEWWGLNDNIRQTADMLNSKAGFGVLAVDLYGGKVATNAEEAGKLMAAVDQKQASATINAALRLLKSGVAGSAPSDKLGTIGFCFGGGWSHKASIMGGSNVQACAVFYGMPTTAPGELERLSAPVLFVWPNKDKWINKSVVDGFKTAMDAAGKSLDIEEYDADHAFANPSSKSYQEKDSQDAWAKTIKFLMKNLG